MEKLNFNYQDYRDDLSDELKEEGDKNKRKELHKKVKETAEYKASKVLRDDKRQERIDDSKITKEEIEKENNDSVKELENIQGNMTEWLSKFKEEAYVKKSKMDVSRFNEHQLKEENFKKNYDKFVLGMRESAEYLKMLIDLFKRNTDKFKNKGFRISFEKDRLNSYDSAMGNMFYNLGFMPYVNLSDSPSAGRVRVKFSFSKNELPFILDIYFPADHHRDLEYFKREVENFKDKINTYLEKNESVPIHKI